VFATLWAKAQFYLAALGAVLLAVGVAFMKGRKSASKEIAADSYEAHLQQQRDYDAVERADTDIESAARRLRDRAGR
jgi:hypothetical protein